MDDRPKYEKENNEALEDTVEEHLGEGREFFNRTQICNKITKANDTTYKSPIVTNTQTPIHSRKDNYDVFSHWNALQRREWPTHKNNT